MYIICIDRINYYSCKRHKNRYEELFTIEFSINIESIIIILYYLHIIISYTLCNVLKDVDKCDNNL